MAPDENAKTPCTNLNFQIFFCRDDPRCGEIFNHKEKKRKKNREKTKHTSIDHVIKKFAIRSAVLNNISIELKDACNSQLYLGSDIKI